MTPVMTDEQLEFFRALCGRFPESQVSKVQGGGGREYTYIDKRALENRLDEVCGPTGWYPEYFETKTGFTCRLNILVPPDDRIVDPSGDVWMWMFKEDGGGSEDMGATNKKTGEWEVNNDNDVKAAYTNALRRAAQDAWGIGRGYYQKGVPSWLAEVEGLSAPEPPPAPRQAPFSPARPPAPAPESGRGNNDRFNKFSIPYSGKAVFAWGKKMEEHFGIALIAGMTKRCEGMIGSRMLTELGEADAKQLCGDVVTYLKTLPNYKGEYDVPADVIPDFGPAPPMKPNAVDDIPF